jgi:hypothetical protein
MRARKLAIVGLIVLLQTSILAEQQRFVLLTASEAKAVAALYPKSGPKKVTGAWNPTEAEIHDLEANLHQVSDLSRKSDRNFTKIEHPETYFRQYVGILQAGQKRIYINAFCGFNGNQPPPLWSVHLITVSDGGSCAWQSLYDPSSKTYLELSVNGVA